MLIIDCLVTRVSIGRFRDFRDLRDRDLRLPKLPDGQSIPACNQKDNSPRSEPTGARAPQTSADEEENALINCHIA